uniref:Uncharacterized protein n=1 Tax=Nelumbo nucifera TaxID=4432 RepID=A0A822Y4X8_NELNU|nr:TPA_asm: hypothetical protein HUJ06_027553 [Nelumbo nucifera]
MKFVWGMIALDPFLAPLSCQYLQNPLWKFERIIQETCFDLIVS